MRSPIDRRDLWTALLWLPPLIFLALFYFYPLGTIFGLSLSQEGAPLGAILGASRLRQVLGFTFGQASLSTLLTLLVGLPGAYLLARFEFRGKGLLRALTGIPFVMPTLVVAAALTALLGPRGWVNLALMQVFDLTRPPLAFTNSLAAILTAHVFYNTTIVLRTVGDFWSRLDPRLEDAAAMLGANRWERLRRVTLPLLAPAILTAALLVFIFDFTSFGVVLILGGPRFATLEIEIYQQTMGLFDLRTAAVLAGVQLLCTLALTVAYTRLTARLARPLTLRPQAVTQQPLRGWRARLGAGLLIAFLVGLMTLPLLALALQSVTALEAGRGAGALRWTGFTLDYYRELALNRRASAFFASPLTSLSISLGYAGMTVVLAVALGLPAAWSLAARPDSRWNRLLDPLLMLPLGTSAVTLGLGFLLALDRPPLNLRASPLLIPLAHTLVAFPFVVRSLTPALRSIRPRLRQAAAVLGAPPGRVFLTVDLPLIGRALWVAAIYAFTISLGEFGATALIARPEYPTLTLAIFRLLGRPGALNYGQALALSTILMVVTAVGMLLIERLRLGEVGEF